MHTSGAALSEIRRAVGLTQKQLAETLGIEQGDLSKLERRQNLHLATLVRFIEATGGRLRITAVHDLGIGVRPGDHHRGVDAEARRGDRK